MQHLDGIGSAPRDRPPSLYSQSGYRAPSHISRDGASMRMVAAMVERLLPASGRSFCEDASAADRLTPFAGEGAENDAQYYQRRSKEECRAAGESAVPEARAAHQELADHYARLARRAVRRSRGARFHHQSAARSRVAGVLRQRFGYRPSSEQVFRSLVPLK